MDDFRSRTVSRWVLCWVVVLASSCSGGSSRAEGELCFGSSECAPGLTCDFGQSPAVCAVTQTVIDASTTPAPVVDAMANPTDANQTLSDAALPVDAAVRVDAAVPVDAALPVDAAVDATIQLDSGVTAL